MAATVKLRIGWKSRITVVISPPAAKGMFPWNLESEDGTYSAVFAKEGSIQFRGSEHGGTPFALSVQVTPDSCAYPHIARDATTRIWLVYEQTTGDRQDTLVTSSKDRGETWEEAEVGIDGGRKPSIAVGHDNLIIIAAVVGTAIIARTMQESSDFGDTFTFAAYDGSATADMTVADDTFHIQQERGPASRWLLHVVIAGETATSHWWSADKCRTWTRSAL